MNDNFPPPGQAPATPAQAEAIRRNIEESAAKQEMVRKGYVSANDLNEAAALTDEQAISQRENIAERATAKGAPRHGSMGDEPPSTIDAIVELYDRMRAVEHRLTALEVAKTGAGMLAIGGHLGETRVTPTGNDPSLIPGEPLP
jgi:hypothetical protein